MYVDQRTVEQKAADEARWAAERAEVARRAEAQRQETLAATARAKALLASVLAEEQRQSLAQKGHFEVVGSKSGRRYRIRQGTHGNVRRLSADGSREDTQYCAQPNGVPTEDAMCAQALQLRYDEDAFLAAANATRL